MLVEEEDNTLSPQSPLNITIERPLMIVKELKLKTFQDYNIPIDKQHWVINDQDLNDNDALNCDGSNFKINLNINRQPEQDQILEVNFKLPKTSESEPDKNTLSDSDNITTIKCISIADDLLNEAAALQLPDEKEEAAALSVPDEINLELIHRIDIIEEAAALSVEINLELQDQIEIKKYENSTWKCPLCTLINEPLTLTCSACYQERILSPEEKTSTTEELKEFLYDENYNQSELNNIIEGIFKPIEESVKVPINLVKNTDLSTTSSICNYFDILNLDNNDIVKNSEPFDCPICYINVETNAGCVLHECLHRFCRDCLASTIQYCEDAEVKCPYADGDYSCDSNLQDREIRALVKHNIYEKHLEKSVRHAEHQIQNSFHCKTPNCLGWCIYEDGVHQFECPICGFTNCLICMVIHNGITCYEYQEELNNNGKVKLESERTNELFNEMVCKGEVMNCPTCQVIIMKISGCDWLQCSMCRTEVCWATRKPRRGAAGCNCGVNGVKCHPNCKNCH